MHHHAGNLPRPNYWLSKGKMNIVKALKAEESKFVRQVKEATQQLTTIRKAIELLSGTGDTSTNGSHKRKLSKAGRERIAKAQRARWAKIRAGKNA